MSNLHKNCFWSVSLIRQMFKAKLNCVKYKIAWCDESAGSQKVKIIVRSPRRITLHRTFALFANNFFRSRYLFIIHVVLITPVVIAGSQITRTTLAMPSRSTEQIRSVERALYGATRGLVPKWLVQGSALPRVPPFFSRFPPSSIYLFFHICDFYVSRVSCIHHHCCKI